MKHYVYCAGNFPENKDSIDSALKAVHYLESVWEMNADTHGIYEGSKFIITKPTELNNNYEIYAEDEDIHRLISSCMAFARRHQIILTNKTK